MIRLNSITYDPIPKSKRSGLVESSKGRTIYGHHSKPICLIRSFNANEPSRCYQD